MPRSGTRAGWAERIERNAAALETPLLFDQAERLAEYVALIVRWNATYNLTAIRDPEEMITHHISDCLAAVAPLQRRRGSLHGQRLLDVGSGAGLPGIVFAVTMPELGITCVDSVGKKAAFIQQAAATLQLPNIQALHGRVEALDPQAPYDVVSCRAFSSISQLLALTSSLIADDGCWLALKGQVPEVELRAVAGFKVDVETIAVPGLIGERCLVWLERCSAKAGTNS